MTSLGLFSVLILSFAIAGCSARESSTSPSSIASPSASSATAPRAVAPAQLAYVMDTSYRRLPGARVEIVDGPQAGTVLTADEQGQFLLTGPFQSSDTFRASHNGYVTATQGFRTSAPGGTPWLMFYLRAVEAPVNLAGDYTLTMVADSACADLPSELRSRTYSVSVTPKLDAAGASDTTFKVAVKDVPVVAGLNGFEIGVAGNTLGFWLDGSHDPTLVERLDTSTYVAYSGLGWATIEPSASTISASFAGWVDYCVMASPMIGGYNCGTSNFTGEPVPGGSVQRVHCDSPRQQLILTRTPSR